MADKTMLAKLKEEAQLAKTKLREARGEARDRNKMASKIPAPALAGIGAGTTYLTGLGDGMAGTPENQNPVTMAGAALGVVGSLVTTFTGHPTLAHGLAASGGACLAVLTHAAGVKRASESKRAA